MVVSPHEKAEDEQQRVNRGGGGGTLNRNASSGAGGASGAGGGGVVKTEKLVFTMPKLQVCTTATVHIVFNRVKKCCDWYI